MNQRNISLTTSTSSAGREDDAVGLQALVLAAGELGLDVSGLVDQHAAQAVAGRPSLPETELDQSALPGEDLCGQFTAVLAGHRALDALDDGGDRRAVVLELLGAVGDLDAGTPADVLVVRRFVGVLKAPPTADVVDQDDAEVGVAGLDVADQALQGLAPVDAKPALALVGVGPHDVDVAARRVLPDLVALVLGGVLLVLRGHAHVLRCLHAGAGIVPGEGFFGSHGGP
jgi:hypothetical protein